MSTTPDTSAFVNAIACDLEEGGFRQVCGTTLRRTLATAVSAALPLLQPLPGTPSSRWAADGQSDPHGDRYACERAVLALGHLTDDELANAVYLHGNEQPSMADLVAGKALSGIVYLTAAKDRIRWLSRALAATGKQQVVKKEHWLDRMAAIEGRIEPSAREMEGMDEEQVGEVQGDALAALAAKWRAQAATHEVNGLEADSIGLTTAAMRNDARAHVLEEAANELQAALAACEPVRIYGCCAQPEGELHTAECPNMRHIAARQPRAQEPVAWQHCDEAHKCFIISDTVKRELKVGETGNGIRKIDRAYSIPLYAAPPAQGIDPSGGMAQEYQRWIDFYHAGEGSYDDFLSKHVLIDGQRDAAPGVGS